MGEGTQDTLPVGSRRGRYIITRFLGTGGMGSVYAAEDPQLQRTVALKLLRPSPDASAEALEASEARLRKEAQLLARLNHPNVLSVFDVGVAQSSVYLAMELIDGSTLDHWRAARRPRVRAIIEAYLQAASGLAAVHSAGLVHGDFKPSNAMIDSAGRVRVTDFGIARPAASPGASDLAAFVRGGEQTTALAGTLTYMAPEQLLGLPVDGRTDQFSFCVSLYEALYGPKPYGGSTVSGRVDGFRHAPAPPVMFKIPAQIRRALLRGLAVEPSDRFSGMEELSRELTGGLSSRRRGLWAGALVLLAVAAYPALRRRPQCEDAQQVVAPAWALRRAEVERAFLASGASFAPPVFREVSSALDAYARQWAAMRTEACVATRVAHSQSDQVLSARMLCLEERRAQLEFLVSSLARANAELVTRAPQAVDGLPRVEDCRDIRPASHSASPPLDARTRERVDGIRVLLARAAALNLAGKAPEALTVLHPAIDEAQSVPDKLVAAEAQSLYGWTEQQAGQSAAAAESLEQAVLMAQAAGADHAAAEALIRLVYVRGYGLAQPAQAEPIARRGKAALERLGGDRELEALLHSHLAGVDAMAGRFSDAVAEDGRALALNTELFGADSVTVAKGLANLANSEFNAGKLESALEHAQKAHSLRLRLLGPDHPDVGNSLAVLGDIERDLGHLDVATARYQAALVILENAEGPEHPEVLLALDGLGEALRRSGHPADAAVVHRRALAANEKLFGPQSPRAAMSLENLGAALSEAKRDDEAEDALRRALAIFEATATPDDPNLGTARVNLAKVLSARGKTAETDALFAEGIAASSKAAPGSVNVARLELAYGGALVKRQAFGLALAQYEQAVPILVRAQGEDSPDLAYAELAHGQVLLSLGRPQEALAPLERAVRICAAKPPDAEMLGNARSELARAQKLSARAPGP